jgi:hypothetical protein
MCQKDWMHIQPLTTSLLQIVPDALYTEGVEYGQQAQGKYRQKSRT